MSKIKNKINSKEGFAEYMKWAMYSYLLGVLVFVSMIFTIMSKGIIALILALILFGFIYFVYKALANAYWALLKHREHKGGKLRVLKLIKAKLLCLVAAVIVWLPILFITIVFSPGSIFRFFSQIYTIVFGLIIAINTEARCLYTNKTSIFATPKKIKEIFSEIGNKLIFKYFGILIVLGILSGVLAFVLVVLAFLIPLALVFILAIILIALLIAMFIYAKGLIFIASEGVFKNEIN